MALGSELRDAIVRLGGRCKMAAGLSPLMELLASVVALSNEVEIKEGEVVVSAPASRAICDDNKVS